MIHYIIFFIVSQNQASPRVSFCAVGDILLDRGTRSMIRQHGVDHPLAEVKEFLTGFDLAYANLESPVSARGRSTGKLYCFRGDTNFFAGVVKAGFDVISIANNHTVDWGQTAFSDTRDIIERHGLLPVGYGAASEVNPAIVEKNGLRFAFFASVGLPLRGVVWPLGLSGPCQADIATLASAIRDIRPEVDFIIAGMHWGEEYKYRPMTDNVSWAHKLIDAGADLVVGSHPHILQSIEFYKGRLILYSLGNFVYDQHKIYQRQSGIFACVFRKGAIDSAAFIPVYLNEFRPGLVKGNEFDSIAARMAEISRDYRTRFRSASDRLFITDTALGNQIPVPIAQQTVSGRRVAVFRQSVEYGVNYGPNELGLRSGEEIKDAAFIPDKDCPALVLISGPPRSGNNRLVLFRIEPAEIRPVALPQQDCRPWKVVCFDLDTDSVPEIVIGGLRKGPFQPSFKNYLFVYEWRDSTLIFKSRSTKFLLPLTDFIFADINADGLKELIALENGSDVVAYQWCGYGFYGYKNLNRTWPDKWLNETGIRKLLNSD